MKYIIENWMTEEIIKVFSTNEEREEWINDNCIWFSDGCFIKDTEIKIACYETRQKNDLRGGIRMSQWTHVNASFRLNSFGRTNDEVLINIFGKSVDYYGMDEIEYDENWKIKDKEKYLPMGSEGTLEMSIWHNSNESCMASTTVSVFGDLRDYDSFEEIEKWFNRCCDTLGNFRIRQAICQVEVEGRGTKIFQR